MLLMTELTELKNCNMAEVSLEVAKHKDLKRLKGNENSLCEHSNWLVEMY